MTIQNLFGNRIKELRNANLMSQDELSAISGIERSQISKIEQGNVNVTLETINRLSKALNVPINKLMDIDLFEKPHPFVKWAGGKTQIIGKLKEFMPSTFNSYFEPFVGGGALLFDILPNRAYINDSNEDLMLAYKCISDTKSFNKLIRKLEQHEKLHSEEYYLEIRNIDRSPKFKTLKSYDRAARMIYLNKSCFNGLYRVNSSGYFNVPSGKKEKVVTYDRENMALLRNYFKNNTVTVLNVDFEESVKDATAGDFVYFDPPYDKLENKPSFTSYSKDSFGRNEQERLAKVFKELDKKGVKVMLSNHNTEFINDLYKDYKIHIIEAKRMINSKGSERGNIEEVIITNY